MIGVSSRKPRSSVQNNRNQSGLKTGACVWGKDVWHAKGENGKTVCGVNAEDFMTLGEVEPDHHFCSRCRKKLGLCEAA